MKIFVSYTLKDGHLDTDNLLAIKSILESYCSSYIDFLDNDSIDKQSRVEDELENSDYLFLIKTISIKKSNWVKKEILIAKENNIPIYEFEHKDLLDNNYHPIKAVILNIPSKSVI